MDFYNIWTFAPDAGNITHQNMVQAVHAVALKAVQETYHQGSAKPICSTAPIYELLD
jgi:hypothetical protein